MRAAARARPVEPEILSPEDARAARIAAETALSAASAAVQSVVDQFPAPQNDPPLDRAGTSSGRQP